ncbi:glucose-1-phosphate adenylyltransferase [Monoraphidium neglectum]|uniref:glucose-1-phosphate adenylyltransferase n=1 Tax=Monoraphidium neglectum TaxID=145388 RepID=A0A0D2MYZ8_9CHLO|nr:glucose-1-phosphate adenylyltransferase [Monoraphidium neglectum]KIY99375.1 glucose-1-phosphate adenylyltransferase [Monoraphidium neglectum]|eukprot:XP_013898395.1 glucose-1-phosphate adenylyltransferase [Monoraphidium neglectum]
MGYKVQAHAFQGYWEDIGTIEAFYNANLALAKPGKTDFRGGAEGAPHARETLGAPVGAPEWRVQEPYFYDKAAPIYTMSRFLPPSKVVDAEACPQQRRGEADVGGRRAAADAIHDAIIGDGCVIKAGSVIKNSVIGLRTLVQENALIEDTLILGADYYETKEAERSVNGPALPLPPPPQECTFVPGCQPIGVGRGAVVRRALVDKNVRIGDNVQIVNKAGVSEANREEEGFIIKDGIVVLCKNAHIKSGTVI